MELRHLIYFEAVARHEHVSRAAAELMLAQPSLTKQIHDLERELGGVELFERVGRNVRLTEAGRALLVRVRAILDQIEQARAEMLALAGARRGRVTVGAPPTIDAWRLTEALAAFHQRFPDVELRIQDGDTAALVGLLDRGIVDLALATLPVPARGLWVTPLFVEELVVAVSRTHRLAQAACIDFAALAAEPLLLAPPGDDLREIALHACHRAGFAPRIVLDGGELAVLRRLVEAGLGVALLPPSAVDGAHLAALRVRDIRLERTLALVSRPERDLLPPARVFRRFLEERFLSPATRSEPPGG